MDFAQTRGMENMYYNYIMSGGEIFDDGMTFLLVCAAQNRKTAPVVIRNGLFFYRRMRSYNCSGAE